MAAYPLSSRPGLRDLPLELLGLVVRARLEMEGVWPEVMRRPGDWSRQFPADPPSHTDPNDQHARRLLEPLRLVCRRLAAAVEPVWFIPRL